MVLEPAAGWDEPAPPAERAVASMFGENLGRERRLQGKSTRALAQLAGMHASQISRLENGLADPKVSTVVRLARALKRADKRVDRGTFGASARFTPSRRSGGEGIVLDRIVYRRLGDALRQERRRLNLRQDDVALVAGLGLRAVGEIEALADTVRRVLSAATAVPPVTDAALACSIKAARNGEECEACQ